MEDFKGLCAKHRCDKSLKHSGMNHDYSATYESLRPELRAPRILEIGTGNARLMTPLCGKGYRPGAGARVYREFFGEGTLVVTVDRDPEAVQLADDRENGITAIAADAYTLGAPERILAASPVREFDLICDDGSHKPSDQITAAILYRPLLKPGGYLIIEDISREWVTDLLLRSMGGKRVADPSNPKYWLWVYRDPGSTDQIATEN